VSFPREKLAPVRKEATSHTDEDLYRYHRNYKIDCQVPVALEMGLAVYCFIDRHVKCPQNQIWLLARYEKPKYAIGKVFLPFTSAIK